MIEAFSNNWSSSHLNISINSNICCDISSDVRSSWNWVCYRTDDKGRKIPLNPRNPDSEASAEDNCTWAPYDIAVKKCEGNEENSWQSDVDGIGLVVVRQGKNVIEYDDFASVTVEDLPITRFGKIPVKQDQPEEESPSLIDTDPRLTINLEETNFVRRYSDHCSSITDAYPEYHHAGALTLLSFAADRKVSMRLKNGTYYTNIWCLCLGQSTTSRKSTALGYVADLLDEENHERRLSDQFSPESFIEQMSSQPHSYLINDECGGLFKALNKKQYMADLKDTLCKVYDNRHISRKLRTNQKDKSVQTDFIVKGPYLTILFSTTFESLANSVIEDDFTSGLMPRFLPYYPSYVKESRGIDDETDDDELEKAELLALFRSVRDSISRVGTIRMRMSETGKTIYNQWLKQKDKELLQNQDPIVSSVFGRYQVYALKMAMLFTMGSRAFLEYIDGLDPGSEVEYTIPDEYVIEAIREIDEYFIQTIVTIREKITIHGTDDLKAKILDMLKRVGGEIEHSKLLKACKKSRAQFHEAVQTLIDMEMVTEIRPTNQQQFEERKKNPNYKPNRKYRLNTSSS